MLDFEGEERLVKLVLLFKYEDSCTMSMNKHKKVKEEILKYAAKEVSEYVGRTVSDRLENDLQCGDFDKIVTIKFDDYSKLTFRWAFYVALEKDKHWAVFTEHNSYHLFSSMGNKISDKEMFRKQTVHPKR